MKFVGLAVLFACFNHTGVSQPVGIDKEKIESLIDQWNFANNTRNVYSFEKVYSDRLVFYGGNVTRSKAIALKRQLFRRKPYFRQRIITEIIYKAYSRGVIRCDFTREIFEKTYWKKYPSYLLVSYADNRYRIVGESDYPTGKALEYQLEKPEKDEPMTFEKVVADPDSIRVDSLFAATSPPDDPDSENTLSDLAELRWTTLRSLFSDPSSMGMVTIPKGYVFLLIGFLVVGALMILIADSVQASNRKRRTRLQGRDEAEPVVQDFKMQSVFEAFVITLFDPLYFRYRRPKDERVYAGNVSQIQSGPDLEFAFSQKETYVPFAIKCQYYKHIAKNEVQLFSLERRRAFRQFGDEREMDLYYVLGFGGAPDDPKELYFVPAKAARSEFISKTALRQFSKSGMFYYNRGTGSIQ